MKLDHLSFSQWKGIATCPAAWHAERVRGVYAQQIKTDTRALGTLLHAALLPPHVTEAVLANEAEWLATRKGITSKASAVLAAAKFALERDDVQQCLNGAVCEVSVQAELGGIVWTGRLDIHNRAQDVIVELKSCRDCDATEWSRPASLREHYTSAALYWHQLALYRRLTGGTAAVAILAIEADDVPNVWIEDLMDDQYDDLDAMADMMIASYHQSWTSPVTGVLLPPIVEMAASRDGAGLHRCEVCDWCKQSRTNLFRPFAFAKRRGP